MGAAIAERFADRGAIVTLVAGKMTARIPDNLAETCSVTSTHDMFLAVTSRVPDMDYIVMAAAPADYTPVTKYDSKVKSDALTLELRKTEDIAAAVGKMKREDTKLVIFSAETDHLLENAKGKLIKKGADLVVANDVTKEGAGFETDTNIVTIIDKAGAVRPYDKMPKIEVADAILDYLKKL